MTSPRLVTLSILLMIVTAVYGHAVDNSETRTASLNSHETWLEQVIRRECRDCGRMEVGGYWDGVDRGVKSDMMLVHGDGSAYFGDERARGWVSGGVGWEVKVEMRTWPHTQSVSSLDWFMRWDDTKQCLSSAEWDNVDNFEIDEVALKFFWDRVWGCFLEYAAGRGDRENGSSLQRSRKTSKSYEVPGLARRQSNRGFSRIIARMRSLGIIIVALMFWLGRFGLDAFEWWATLMLDLIEAIIALFYRLSPGN